MPTHDIIDNRKEKLVDHINRILSSTESARFAAPSCPGRGGRSVCFRTPTVLMKML
jgi:hypothetical protein